LQLSVVQGLLSLQSAGVVQETQPAIGVCVHPVTGLQLSVVQALPSSQLRADPGVQTPIWQVSLPLQTLPSLHDVPFATAAWPQPSTGSQVSVVQGLLSSQLSGAPAVHVPPWQVSFPLQTVASGHGVLFATAVFWQPRIGSHESVVQALLSLQSSGVPAVQIPF
jgi:hypothetical protein